MTFFLQIVILIGYTALLLFWGFQRRPSFASWHMFANLNRVMFELRYHDSNGAIVNFNPWDYLPHTYFTMSLTEALIFLRYIETFHRLKLFGLLRVWKDNTYATYLIENNELAS